MKAIKVKFLACILFLCACSCNQYGPVFVQVVSDHRMVAVETLDSLIASIEADMKERSSSMSSDDVIAVNNLIDRLNFIKQGSIVIEKYVMSQADEETLAKVLRNKLK